MVRGGKNFSPGRKNFPQKFHDFSLGGVGNFSFEGGGLCLSFDADLLDKRIIGNAKKIVGRDIESCQG